MTSMDAAVKCWDGTDGDLNSITVNHLVDGVPPISRISDLVEGCFELRFRKSHFSNPGS